jgi:hypothetical protein
MSKSMNKYHKRSGSGMLPGWVKVGAVALGVGVGMGGVPEPEEEKCGPETTGLPWGLMRRCRVVRH